MELGTRPGPMVMDRDPRVREALESMLRAADGINDPTGEVPDGELQSHNEARQGEILLEWERLAILTGNGKLAWENNFRPDGERMDRILTMPDDGEPEPEWERKTRESPLLNGIDWVEYHVPGMVLLEETLRSLDDPYTAMGYAMRHLGFAVLQYGLVSDFRPGTAVRGGALAADRYLWGEIEARCAHRLLHRVYVDLSELTPEAPDLRKSCRQAKVLLTRERARAALALGIDPPPQVTDDLMREEMDHHAWELDPPEPAGK